MKEVTDISDEQHTIEGSFHLLSLVRVIGVPYDVGHLALLRLHVQGKSTSADFYAYLNSLDRKEQEMFVRRYLATLHELFHYHQHIMTTTGFYLTLNLTTRLYYLLRLVSSQLEDGAPLERCSIDDVHGGDKCLLERYLSFKNDAEFLLLPKLYGLKNLSMNGCIGLSSGDNELKRQLPCYSDELNEIFPTGGSSILESWAHILCRCLANKAFGIQVKSWYETLSRNWKYTLIDRILVRIWPRLEEVNSSDDYFKLVSMICLFSLNPPTKNLEYPDYLTHQENVCGFRLANILLLLEKEKNRIFSDRSINFDELERIITAFETYANWSPWRSNMIQSVDSSKSYLTKAKEEVKRLGQTGSAQLLVANHIHKQRKHLIELFVSKPSCFFSPIQWGKMVHDYELPRPPLSIHVETSQQGNRNVLSFMENKNSFLSWVIYFLQVEICRQFEDGTGIKCPMVLHELQHYCLEEECILRRNLDIRDAECWLGLALRGIILTTEICGNELPEIDKTENRGN